ncbi:hypothetical protein GCM10023321_80590 [Pseudonocardia eucalypti]|uniref:Uncharacterized protein n=1 Tax=Pseudonocardia eucalypti TaxID=648755 RepID=A0ABP9RCK6_9PSEU
MNVAAIHSIAAPSKSFPNDSDASTDSNPRATDDRTAHARRRPGADGEAIEAALLRKQSWFWSHRARSLE